MSDKIAFMAKTDFILITDRGGHLHNALMLVEQMGFDPDTIVTTHGPDIDCLKTKGVPIFCVPYLFTWIGKQRLFNPFSFFLHTWISLRLAWKLKPRRVVSLGAGNVVFFCYWAKLMGAEIYHVECMNQVVSPSITGRLLYPISSALYVQWKELLKSYGRKAQYQGWVL